MDVNQIKKVLVIGGGDAGLLAALTLNKLASDIDVTVVDDFAEDPPNVGKSTISYIVNTLHNVLEIDRKRFISEVKPVWKASAYFKEWCGNDPFHFPFDDFTIRPDDDDRRFEHLYQRYLTGNFHTIGEEITEQRKSPFRELGGENLNAYEHVAYHLSVSRLNAFLRELCEERGVELVDDRVTTVDVSGDTIVEVSSRDGRYESDLYVDATGFKRMLMGEVDNQFREFDFPLDSALVAKTDLQLSDIVPATVIRSASSGWFWQIDTFDWRDVGYVYSSDHISDADATEEFVGDEHIDISEADIQQYRFQSGCFEDAWVGNCIAVGNALGFVEPLQSTALTTNAILTEKLSNLLVDHHGFNHDGIRGIYNRYAWSLWENIYDFISIHYRYTSAETPFWKDMRSVNDDERLRKYIHPYLENGLTSHREFNQWQFFQDNLFYRVFNQWQFYRILRSLEVRSNFYDELDFDVGDSVKQEIEARDDDIRKQVDALLTYEELDRRSVY